MDENEIAYELNKIIREIRSLASQIESDFEGVGECFCASSLRTCANQYSKVVSQLQNIKTK